MFRTTSLSPRNEFQRIAGTILAKISPSEVELVLSGDSQELAESYAFEALKKIYNGNENRISEIEINCLRKVAPNFSEKFDANLNNIILNNALIEQQQLGAFNFNAGNTDSKSATPQASPASTVTSSDLKDSDPSATVTSTNSKTSETSPAVTVINKDSKASETSPAATVTSSDLKYSDPSATVTSIDSKTSETSPAVTVINKDSKTNQTCLLLKFSINLDDIRPNGKYDIAELKKTSAAESSVNDTTEMIKRANAQKEAADLVQQGLQLFEQGKKRFSELLERKGNENYVNAKRYYAKIVFILAKESDPSQILELIRHPNPKPLISLESQIAVLKAHDLKNTFIQSLVPENYPMLQRTVIHPAHPLVKEVNENVDFKKIKTSDEFKKQREIITSPFNITEQTSAETIKSKIQEKIQAIEYLESFLLRGLSEDAETMTDYLYGLYSIGRLKLQYALRIDPNNQEAIKYLAKIKEANKIGLELGDTTAVARSNRLDYKHVPKKALPTIAERDSSVESSVTEDKAELLKHVRFKSTVTVAKTTVIHNVKDEQKTPELPKSKTKTIPPEYIAQLQEAKDHKETLLVLGECYLKGRGVAKDEKKAFHLFLAAAEMKQSEAQLAVAICQQNGIGTTKDEKAALKWLTEAAEKHGNVDAKLRLGLSYQNGWGTRKDEKLAFKYFKKASKSLHPSADIATYHLGTCYENGNGTEKDMKAAEAAYQSAAENFHEEAILQRKIISPNERIMDEIEGILAIGVGMIASVTGIEIEKIVTEQEVKALETLSDKGDPSAQFTLLSFYVFQLSNKTDKEKIDVFPEALIKKLKKWFMNLLFKNYPHALMAMAWTVVCCAGMAAEANDNGLEAEENAVRWVYKAAVHGHFIAQAMLANNYDEEGDSEVGDRYINHNNNEAFLWYLRSALQGWAEAQYHLGLFYQNGKAVPKDMKKAIFWMNEAAKSNHKEAKQWLMSAPDNKLESVKPKIGIPLGDLKYPLEIPASVNPFQSIPLHFLHKFKRTISPEMLHCFPILVRSTKSNEIDLALKLFMGELYLQGQSVKKDEKRAVQLFTEVAEYKGSHAFQLYLDAEEEWMNLPNEEIIKSQAQHFLALCHAEGIGTEKNREKAENYFKEATSGSWPEMTNGLLNFALFLAKQNKATVAFWRFEDLVSNEDISYAAPYRGTAAYYVGLCYEHGFGTEKNILKAQEYYQKAAKANNKQALLKLKKSFPNGVVLSSEEKVPAKVIPTTEDVYELALTGDRDAQWEFFAKEKNEHAGLHWALRAALQGQPEAIYGLFRHLFDEEEEALEIQWLMEAAKQGHIESIDVLCYLVDFSDRKKYPDSLLRMMATATPTSSKKDSSSNSYIPWASLGLDKVEEPDSFNGRENLENTYKRLINNFTYLARLGHAESQYALGSLYVKGTRDVVSKDKKLGMSWLNKAASQGHLKAKRLLAKLTKVPLPNNSTPLLARRDISPITVIRDPKNNIDSKYGAYSSFRNSDRQPPSMMAERKSNDSNTRIIRSPAGVSTSQIAADLFKEPSSNRRHEYYEKVDNRLADYAERSREFTATCCCTEDLYDSLGCEDSVLEDETCAFCCCLATVGYCVGACSAPVTCCCNATYYSHALQACAYLLGSMVDAVNYCSYACARPSQVGTFSSRNRLDTSPAADLIANDFLNSTSVRMTRE